MLCEVEIKYVNSFDTYKPFFSNIATMIQENVCNLHVLSFRRTALCQSGKLKLCSEQSLDIDTHK